jgi:hypothetical protein
MRTFGGLRSDISRALAIVLAFILGAAVYLDPAQLNGVFEPVPGRPLALAIPPFLLITALVAPAFLAAMDTILCVMAIALLAGIWLGWPVAHDAMSWSERWIASGLMLTILILAGGSVVLQSRRFATVKLPHC